MDIRKIITSHQEPTDPILTMRFETSPMGLSFVSGKDPDGHNTQVVKILEPRREEVSIGT